MYRHGTNLKICADLVAVKDRRYRQMTAEKLFADAAEAFTIFQTGGKFSSLDFYHSVMG